MSLRKTFLAVLAAVGLFLAPATAAENDDLATLILAARTARDHEQIAARFDDMARKAERKVERHQRILESYVAAPDSDVQNAEGAEHCRALVAAFQVEERHYLEMAAGHRAMAQTRRPAAPEDR